MNENSTPASGETKPADVAGDDAAVAPDSSGAVAALQAELASVRAELTHAQDRHRRALADLDNYRKRVARDGEVRASEARAAMLHDWLAALDSVELALRMQPDDEGLRAVLQQMEAILERNGIRRQDVVGHKFDPMRHEAISVLPAAEGVDDQQIIDVGRSGFESGEGEVVRPAHVVVARRPAGGH